MSNKDVVNRKSISHGLELELELLETGADTLPPSTQIIVDGVTYTPETFAQRVRAELAPFKAVRNAKLLLAQAFAERRETKKASRSFASNARAALVGALGGGNPDLERFGVKPRKERTPETLDHKVE